MRKETQKVDPDLLRSMGYETRDIALPAIIKALAGFFLFSVIMLICAWFSYAILVPGWGYQKAGLAQTPGRRLPADQPALQADPRAEMQDFRAKETQAEKGYGWVDQPKGIAHIPVDVARDLIVQKGLLPVRGSVSAPTTTTTNVAPVAPGTAPTSVAPPPGGPTGTTTETVPPETSNSAMPASPEPTGPAAAGAGQNR